MLPCPLHRLGRDLIAAVVDQIYWADAGAGAILGLRLDGSAIRVLAAGLQEPEHVALDVTRTEGAYLYWGDSKRNVIERCLLSQAVAGNCTSVNTVLTDVQVVAGLAVDAVANFLYWADGASLRLRRAPLDHEAGSVIAEAAVDVIPLVHMPSAIALELGSEADPQAQAVYYIDQRTPVSISRYSLNGSASHQLLVEHGLSRPRAIAVGLQARSWFVVDSGTRELRMATMDTHSPNLQLLLRDVALQPRGLAVRSDLQVRQTLATLQESSVSPSARGMALSCAGVLATAVVVFYTTRVS